MCAPVKWRLAGMLPREWRKCTLSAELILNPLFLALGMVFCISNRGLLAVLVVDVFPERILKHAGKVVGVWLGREDHLLEGFVLGKEFGHVEEEESVAVFQQGFGAVQLQRQKEA